MPEYYFDIETYAPGPKPDPLTDKIITIQYQRLSSESGQPEGDLRILTEWEAGSEKAMLDAFKPIFITERDFDFIPIGENLYGYDLIVLVQRLNHHYNLSLGLSFFRNRPFIDLKPTLVMMNKGRFSGYGVLLGQKGTGAMVKGWYEAKDYPKIVDYIKEEAQSFINAYQILKRELPRIKF